ncbi:MAG: hypothetical protein IJ958_05265 [Agathobacter sp.]|nr:hypothetical protein [Agathobacter sp.]
MENTIQLLNNVQVNSEMDKKIPFLDKGIDDIEAERIYSVDEAFAIIEERLKNEI